MKSADAQIEERIKAQYELSQKTAGWFEGFYENIGGNEFVYESVREDVTKSLLTRTTNGTMAIEWLTQTIPTHWKGNHARFLWIAAMDKPNMDKEFSMYINGELKFRFTNPSDDWEVESSDGGKLGFKVFMSDRHGDGHGYMFLHAPATWITPGEGLHIRIVGEAAGSNTWCIIYQAKDALSYLHSAAKHELWFDLSGRSDGKTHYFILTAPEQLAKKTLKYQIGNEEYELSLVEEGGHSRGDFSITGNRNDLSNIPFSIYLKGKKLFGITGLFTRESQTDLRELSLVINQVSEEENGDWHLKTRIVYKPKLISGLKRLSNASIKNGTIFLMNSSHQDIAWMDSPENCIIERDTMLLTPLFNQAGDYPEYRFDIEDVLMIREFIERHLDRKGEIHDLLHSGNITVGSSFNQPYEEMYSGESLVRQFYLGAKWISKEFGGYKPDTYWNIDVPGRTLQMPQIARKAGTKYMVISRHKTGLFRWYSPDGSFVTTYSPGHYSLSYPYLQRDFFSAAAHIADQAIQWNEFNTSTDAAPAIPLLSDWDMSPAEDYRPMMERWHNLRYIEDQQGIQTKIHLPKIKIAAARTFIQNMLKSTGNLPTLMGERPAVWLYIHGPSHQKALKASREGDILITAAEKFSAIGALLAGSFENYPHERLTRAWEAKIYPDHGWGGKNGEITDALFREKYEFARNEAEEITSEALHSISSSIHSDQKKGIPVIVFNSLSWERDDPVKFYMNFKNGWGRNLAVFNDQGKPVKCQVRIIEKYPDNSLKSAELVFIAKKVPSLGYVTYYISPAKKSVKKKRIKGGNEFENDYYRITMGNGIIEQIFDKELDINLLDNSNLKGGEIFTMRSEGNGAGEFADIQQPTLEGFDKVSNYPAEWRCSHQGEVFSSFTMKQPIKNATIEQELIFYNDIKRIDIQIALLDWDGTLYREFRMALPLDMKDGRIAYEVPFGVVEVGKDEIDGAAGERYTTVCKDIHPRGIENWIAAFNDMVGVTLSSSVAVADYIDPTGKELDKPVLQPILLASRKSCHWEGNEYLQPGDHHFSFSLFSHHPDWKDGYRLGKQANEKLFVVVNPQKNINAQLPEKLSFFSTGDNNIVISAIKKCEDDDHLIVRIYESEGLERKTHLLSYFKISGALKTNIIEEEKERIPVENKRLDIEIDKHSIETFKLVPVFQQNR